MTLPARLAAKLPAGTILDVPDLGRVVVWDTGPPPDDRGEPPLVMLHGWNVDAGLNFANALDHLTDRYRVVMFDLRGHGRGFRGGRFDLERCADDTLATLQALGIDRFVPVGYSMGGAIAQLLARRNGGSTCGLVVAATAATFSASPRERAETVALRIGAAGLEASPHRMRAGLFERIASAACRSYPTWVRTVVLRADPVQLLQAGVALRSFDSTPWIHQIDLPTAVVITEHDRVVEPSRQFELAAAMPRSTALTVRSDHDLPIRHHRRYGEVIRGAVDAVMS